MPLQADLSARLDAGGPQATLVGEIGDLGQLLDGIDLPLDADALAAIDLEAGRIDIDAVLQAVVDLSNELEPLLGDLPDPSGALAGLAATIEAVEQVANADLATRLTELGERLRQLLDADQGDPLTTFMRLLDALEAAPETGLLKELYAVLGAIGGGGLPPLDQLAIGDFPAAFQNTAQVLGALMRLETALEEAARLGGVMRSRLDPDELASLQAGVEAALTLEGQSLSAFVAAVDSGDSAAVEAGARAIADVQIRMRGFSRALVDGMAMGEATLVYLDMPALQGRVDAALGEVRGVDLAPLERAATALSGFVQPLLNLDLPASPATTLAGMLDQVEAKASEIASEIETLDLARITDPLTDTLSELTAIEGRLADEITAASLTVRAGLESVRDAIVRLPFDRIAAAIAEVVDVVAAVLAAIGDALAAVGDAIGDAADALIGALQQAENALNAFQTTVDALFEDARSFVAGLDLDATVGTVAGEIEKFSAVVAKADMAPYFGTAVGAIDDTAAVVEKVPFNLLPDSMEQEVVDAIRPIKQTDADAVRREIQEILQIGEDGTFTLRPDLQAAVQTVQDKIDDLLAAVRGFDPELVVEALEGPLADFETKLDALGPIAGLEPVRAALDRAKATVAALDLDAALAPLRDGFDRVLAAVDAADPAQLVQPLSQRLDAAREAALDVIKARDWLTHLDTLENEGRSLVDRLEPTVVEAALRGALEEARERLASDPRIQLLDGLGPFLAALLAGSGDRVLGAAFERVVDWLSDGAGALGLQSRTRALADALDATLSAARSVDPQALSQRLFGEWQAVRLAVQAKEGDARIRLEASLDLGDPIAELGRIAANRTRYLQRLEAARSVTQALRSAGFGEIDAAAQKIARSFAPLQPLRDLANRLGRLAGLAGLDRGLTGVLNDLFAIASAERLTGIVMIVLNAVRARYEALIASVTEPIRGAINGFLTAADALSLAPLEAELSAVHAAVRSEIEVLHPDTLLAGSLGAWSAAQADVAAFDPLGDVEEALEEVGDRAAAVVGKLDARVLLATPIEVFDLVLTDLERLDVTRLLTPVLDQLDAIAAQVDTGLEDTVVAFKRLQDALPSQVGGTSLSGAAAVSVG